MKPLTMKTLSIKSITLSLCGVVLLLAAIFLSFAAPLSTPSSYARSVGAVATSEVPEISKDSHALQQKGAAAQVEGDIATAIDYYESALVADPRNYVAYITLAEVAAQQGLTGKALAYYRAALSIAPSNMIALAGQGTAFVDKGAMERAQETLTKIQDQCAAKDCDYATRLQQHIADKEKQASARALAQTVAAEDNNVKDEGGI